MAKQLTLLELKDGQTASIANIDGGKGVIGKFIAIGIRPGKKIKKISSVFGRGPVTIRIGSTELAIGFGMAAKVTVEI